MLPQCLAALVFINVFNIVLCKYDIHLNSQNVISSKTYAIWKNATVPFYVSPEHFDHEQTLSILTALSMFAFKTCIKFKPVMARPAATDDVMVFINPDGVRRCIIETRGHSVFNPHLVKLGYECLQSPQIDMMIMKAIGFPFEHNRITRDLYVDVLQENVEPGAIELFTKEDTLPLELRFLPYDINSVMHFGTRDYSKNGHRTIIFKDLTVQQKREGLSQTDLKKIEIVYGPECRARDRQEKIQLCQSYPGVARKKREADDNVLDEEEHSTTEPVVARRKRDIDLDTLATKSLRVNPNITPPPQNLTDEVTKTLKDLGIDQSVQEIVEHVYKVSSVALKNAREKYCNKNDTNALRTEHADIKVTRNSSDILGIIEVVAEYAKSMVDEAVKNVTNFCQISEGIEVYQRQCDWNRNDPRCRQSYKSTKSGPVRYSTQHRPTFQKSTYHRGGARNPQYGREGNVTDDYGEPTTKSVRRKREAETTSEKPAEKNDATKKPEAKERSEAAVENVKEEKVESKAKVIEVKKADAALEKRVEVTEENKGDAAKETKGDAKEKKAEDKENTEINVQNDGKKNEKQNLRMGTTLPGLKRSRYNRKSLGENHRARYSDETSADQTSSDSKELEHHKKRKHQDTHKKEKKRLKKLKRGESHKSLNKKRGHKKKTVKHLEIPVEDAIIDSRNKEGSDSSDEENELTLGVVPIIKEKKYGKDAEVVKFVKEDDTEVSLIEERLPKQKLRKKKQNRESSSLPRTVPLTKKNDEFYKERRWPDGEVVYMIQEDTTYDLTDMRTRLAAVNRILKKKTCVKLKEIQAGEQNKYEDYIVIDNSPDYVTGRVGGKQKFGNIELFRGGQHRQHAAMVVMAMLGFYFEVSRHDRDQYIRVHMRHVRPDKLHHFEMIRSDATLAVPYDYASATHPAWQFWRQMGRTGISTVATYKEKDPDGSVMKSLGQNQKLLSDIDIVKINSVYGIDCFQRPRAKIDPTLTLTNVTIPKLLPKQG